MARCKTPPRVGEKFIASFNLSVLREDDVKKFDDPRYWDTVTRTTSTRVFYDSKTKAHYTDEQLKKLRISREESILASEAFTKDEAIRWLEGDIESCLDRIKRCQLAIESVKKV